MADPIDTDAFRSHCQDWTGNDDAIEQCFAIADEVDRLRAVRDAVQRVVDGDWRDDDLDAWDALGTIRAALEADRG